MIPTRFTSLVHHRAAPVFVSLRIGVTPAERVRVVDASGGVNVVPNDAIVTLVCTTVRGSIKAILNECSKRTLSHRGAAWGWLIYSLSLPTKLDLGLGRADLALRMHQA